MIIHHTTFRQNKPAVQAAGQTLLDATPPIGKIHPFSKIAVTLNQYSDLDDLQDLDLLKNVHIVCFMTGSNIFNCLGVAAL